MAGKQVNNLAGRKSDRGRRPEKEWRIIGIMVEERYDIVEGDVSCQIFLSRIRLSV